MAWLADLAGISLDTTARAASCMHSAREAGDAGARQYIMAVVMCRQSRCTMSAGMP